MHPRGPCVAVIPCWNEAPTIGGLVGEVRRCSEDVIVVDDGSVDASAARAAAAGAEVVRHERNRGKGAALRSGLSRALERGFAWAVTLDADGQHAASHIPAFLERAGSTGAALVVGNRMRDAAAMPPLRRLVNQAMSRALSLRTSQPLPDSQCGFRLIRLDAWSRLRLETRHFEVESETLVAFVAAGLRVEFVPIPVLPASRPSRIRPVRDTCRWLRWWWASRPVASPAASATSVPVAS